MTEWQLANQQSLHTATDPSAAAPVSF